MLTFTNFNTKASGVGENVDHHHFNTMVSFVREMVTLCNGYVTTIVIIGKCYAYYCGRCCLNLVLCCGKWCATEADVIASLLINGRCYSHVADGMATVGWIYLNLIS